MTRRMTTPPRDDLEPVIENIARQVRLGFDPSDAARQLAEMLDGARVRAALVEYLRRVGDIRYLRDPPGLQADDLPGWYAGPCESDDCYWPRLRHSMAGRLVPDAITDIDRASTKIVSLLPPPGRAEFHSRGLVLGYVQSGKTANYTAVIAKAADANYKVFIVLSGIHEALRRQTQNRLYGELCLLDPEQWVALTSSTQDFTIRAAGNADFFLTQHHDHRVLIVVKKNQSRLRRLIGWLRSARPNVLAACPILVIDDEADQAGVNASDDPVARTRINQLIIELLQTPPKAAYVGYTATPFANLLIDLSDQTDLYPRDFIVDLPRPHGYFGPERIFGRDRLTQEQGDEIDGLDIIRRIPDDEVPLVKPPGRDHQGWSPELTSSMRDALNYFVLATAARRARNDPDLHSSMLIHTTMYTDVHEAFRPLVSTWRETLAVGLDDASSGVEQSLEDQWAAESGRVDAADLGAPTTTFDQLRPHLRAVVETLEVIVENSRSQIRLEYGEVGRPLVVIGGNTLSRGLTLRGLIVSYFVRSASAYDTLLQMGRWFGYRPGYADLPRVWMTAELEGYFFDLATVEHEIRDDIKLYELEDATPTQFAVRIRTHPALSITARAKMQAAVVSSVSYSGRRPQMIYYHHRDAGWLERNRLASWDLLERAIAAGRTIERTSTAAMIIRSVGVEAVLGFVAAYQFHERAEQLRRPMLEGYIRDQVETGELLRWNLAIIGRRPRETDRLMEIGPGLSVPLLNRAKIAQLSNGMDAYLGAIMSQADVAVDLDLPRDEIDASSLERLMARRPEGLGLLLLYPIDRDSVPQRQANARSGRRSPLEAVDDLIGVAFVFPRARVATPQEYMSADLSRVPRDPLDLPEDLEEDDAGEAP